MLDLLRDNAAAIAAHLVDLGWIDADEAQLHLEVAGPGNMNRTLRARLPQRTLILKQSVPFVAKYPSIGAPADRIVVEAAFYAATREPPELAMLLPAVLGFDAANRLLALEDLGAGADFTDIYAEDGQRERSDFGAEQHALLLRWLGLLHRKQLAPDDYPELQNHSMRALNHAHIFDIPLRSDNGLDLDTHTPGLNELAALYHTDAELRAKLLELGEIYLGRIEHLSTPTLLHGDFYPGSWLRDPRRGIAIIDPEFAFVGPAEFDVGVLIAHFTFARIGQIELQAALAHYRAPTGFSLPLALAFAGAEVIRRLLGVAQLPLPADLNLKSTWLAAGRQFVTAL